MKVFVVVCMLAVAFRLVAAVVVPSAAPGGLTVGYYNGKCNNVNVESIVYNTVKDFLDADRSKGAALVRLLFHDCFVRVNTTNAHATMHNTIVRIIYQLSDYYSFGH
jgi:peroxidase